MHLAHSCSTPLRVGTTDDRVVIVWRKFTEGEGVYAGMHSDETGWNIVRPSSDGAGTVMESIIRYVPMSFSTWLVLAAN
ncbi:hypothetical protein GQ600_16579 [Phytophthora cactorum]|nr:hypothetical protein GQ600_16579 [Phytophthora cactorum]